MWVLASLSLTGLEGDDGGRKESEVDWCREVWRVGNRKAPRESPALSEAQVGQQGPEGCPLLVGHQMGSPLVLLCSRA